MTEQLRLKASIGKITLDMTTSTTSVNLTPLALAQIMAQAVMFALALKSWPLHDQAIHSRLHAHEKEQQQVRIKQGDTGCSLCYQVVGQKRKYRL